MAAIARNAFQFLVLFSLQVITHSGNAQTGWTPEVMIKFKRVDGTVMSPDGKLIAYTVSTPIMEEEKSEYLTHIWVISADGKFNQQYTRGEKSCTNPAFTPDGKYLTFLSDRQEKEKKQIYLLPVTGGEAQQITIGKSGVNAYAWSPDGQRIAFTMTDPETDHEEKSKKAKRDMKRVAADYKYAHLHTITLEKDATGKRKVQRLTAGNFHITSLDWSAEGKTLAFSHQVNPQANEWPTTDISSVPSDSGAVHPLVSWSGFDGHPHYSPDGRWLAFVSDGGEARWATATDVYIIPSFGGEPKKLAAAPDRQPQILGWSPSCKEIFFSESERTCRRIFSLPINGAAPQMITSGAGNFFGASWSSDGKIVALIHETPNMAPNVYISSSTKFNPRKLTDVNADFPKFPMGRTEAITWKSKDGMEIEGLLTYPVNYELDKLYPLVLQIHGGPAGVFTQNFTAASAVYPLQAFAQQRYTILRPNPRGSSGYGKDFRFANYNDWGFGDYEDLMAGVNKVLGMNVAHPDSLCVMGWSYGGFITSFIITKTNRFKAASVGAGVTNLMSFTGTADIPSFLPDYFGGEPWERIDTYMKHSAMFNITDVKTPTLIIHGEDDRRVPLSQGQELYNALQRQGCPVEMVVYPRTSHGVREPKFIQDVGERIIAWFNTQLGRRRAEPVVAK